MATETTKNPAPPKAAPPEPRTTKPVYVRAVHGPIQHLFTGVTIGADPKQVEIDGFLRAQIDAGKDEILTL